jgi:hypothetical protein
MHEHENQERDTEQNRYRTEYSAAQSVHSSNSGIRVLEVLTGRRLKPQLGKRLIQHFERMIDLVLVNVQGR